MEGVFSYPTTFVMHTRQFFLQMVLQVVRPEVREVGARRRLTPGLLQISRMEPHASLRFSVALSTNLNWLLGTLRLFLFLERAYCLISAVEAQRLPFR